MSNRLPARLEANALMRRAESGGGFATIVRKGDPDRGSLILLVAERGTPMAVIERRMAADFTYRWTVTATAPDLEGDKLRALTENHVRFDPDCWLIELDIPDAQRFVAETLVSG